MTIKTINMNELLRHLKANTKDVLTRIHEDDALAKQRVGDLIIANAGPGLIEPKTQHQLYAKGIVYTPEMELISLPLIKFYNHGERKVNIEYTKTLVDQPNMQFVCTEKLDGSMIQAFAHDGQVHLTTRSRLTNPHRSDRFSFHDEARAILQEEAPHVLDPQWMGDRTLVFELVSPGNRQYTNYRGRRAMILTSVFDRTDDGTAQPWRYWTAQEIVDGASEWSLPVAGILSSAPNLQDAIDAAYDALAGHPAASPEGFVLNFERQGDAIVELVHRSKIKTPSYKALRRTIDDFNKRNLFRLLVYRPDLRDWSALEQAMTQLYDARGKRGFDDTRRQGFEKYFDAFATWFEEVEQTYQDAIEQVPRYYEEHPREDNSDYHRTFAIYHRDHYPKSFQYMIRLHKQGSLSWDDVVNAYLKSV